MHRPLLLGACAGLLTAAPGASAATATTTPVGGKILATAFAGDALVVARRATENAPIRVELRRPGQGAKLELLTTDTDDEVRGGRGADPFVRLTPRRQPARRAGAGPRYPAGGR